MVEACAVLYRLDFCADMTTAHAPVIPMGYMIEAAVHGGARFLGLASRASLTRVELDEVNLRTWPELANLDDYMGKLFDRAWSVVVDTPGHDLRLGSTALAAGFGAMSALHFGKLDIEADLLTMLQDSDEEAWQNAWYQHLRGFGKLLKPTLTAPVLPMRLPEPAPAADVRPEIRLKAA